ncbi:MAG: hypothetical protein IT437_08045 [Phycisphaerales bacterium]|nr:hypothetical protein [Phycisphaerales bacterium]
MYVGWALLDQGVKLVPRVEWDKAWQGTGPDLMATVEGRRVWVECVAPGPGTGPDGVPEIGDKQIGHVPVDQIKLRFLSALDGKRKQVAKHAAAGIVKPEDAFVVAINSRCIPLAFLTDDPPWIARALYGIGTHAVTYNAVTKEWSEASLTPQHSVTKQNKEPIDANLFGSGKAGEVSGIIYSPVDPWNRKGDLASSLVFIHNLTATVPLPDRWLPFSVSYAVSANGKVGTITRTDPESPPSTHTDHPSNSGPGGTLIARP